MKNKYPENTAKNMLKAISENGGVALCALDSTAIVAEMERLHRPSGVVSAALGRLLTGASLMGSGLKNPEDSLTLRMNGGGPAGGLVAVSDGEGNVRGYAVNPLADLPPRADGKLDVGGVVGRDGALAVVKDLGLKEPYVGQVPLVSGEVAEDITAYYAASEQTPTVCALGVLVNRDLTIRKAGGYLLQLMPGAAEAEIDLIERNLKNVPPITEFLDGGGDIGELPGILLAGFAPRVLEERRVAYRCGCSRERSAAILKSLGRGELLAMRAEDPQATVECHFCNKTYKFDIDALLAEAGG